MVGRVRIRHEDSGNLAAVARGAGRDTGKLLRRHRTGPYPDTVMVVRMVLATRGVRSFTTETTTVSTSEANWPTSR